MTKLYAQRKDVFDIDKVTVVGSPTITSDGVASGFSKNDCIQTSINLSYSNTCKIIFPFTTSNELTTQNRVYYFNNSESAITLGLTNLSTPTIVWQTVDDLEAIRVVNANYNLTINTSYLIKLEDNGENYSISIKKETDNDWTLLKTQVKTTNLKLSGTLTIGRSLIADYPFIGSIDLKQFSITVDGELVYSPTKPTYLLERRKEGFDLSKFRVIGSPTITEYGVASGFSSGNYITTENKFSIDISKSLEVHLSLKGIKYNPSLGDTGVIRFNADSNIRFDLRYNGQKFFLVSNGTGNASESTGIKYFSYDRDMDVKIIFGLNGSTFYCKIKRSYNENWLDLKTTTINIDDTFTNAFIQFGLGWGNYMTLETGSIDLSQFSITVDGKEVFTGAKEQYYAMRGGM